jgi:acyl carrier protein
VPGAGLIQLKSREAADAVLAPKVDGTRVLQSVLTELTEMQGDEPPELLVLFSSINAVTGGLGQVDYCAANAYLDAVAEAGAGDLPWVAIDWCEWQWDAWTEAAISDPAILAELRQHRAAYGLGFDEGMEALERILASGLRRAVVSTRDLRAVLAQRHSLPEVLGGLDHLAETTRSGRATRPRPDLPVPFTPPEIEDHRRIAALWRDLLGLEEIGIHDDFFQLGGHSLLGLQLLSRLQSTFGVEVPLRTLFDAPTIAELSVAIHDLRTGQDTPAAVEKIAAIDPQSLLENLEELSEEEMNELLARMAGQED